MRFIMNFVLKPSLEHRALVKIAVSLWNQNDVRALIALVSGRNKLTLYPTDEEWKEIEATVLERVAQLPLPQPLKGTVSYFVQTIGLQIYKWNKFHFLSYGLPLSLPFELCWTPQGTVDRKRTAEASVRDESLDLSTRYILACIYCLEDDIIALWDSMPEDLRKSNWHRHAPIYFWSRTMKRRALGHAATSYKAQFQKCARMGNKVAAEHFLPFLQKLTQQEREESLVRAAKNTHYDDVLCLLLSQMDEGQQMEVFKDRHFRVLDCFLQWPWQSFFMEIANCMWDFLPNEDYDFLLTDIIHKVRCGLKDWNYQKLFREFWQKSPHALKSLITNDLDKSQLLPDQNLK